MGGEFKVVSDIMDNMRETFDDLKDAIRNTMQQEFDQRANGGDGEGEEDGGNDYENV